MISHFFIDRPIFASVLSIVFVLAGGVALYTLPVAQYPDVTPPTVLVTAFYPGANAKTVLDTVAAPIEEQVSGVEGMLYMESQSTNDGFYRLSVTFNLGMNSDMAQVLVQNRVSLALPVIPQLVQNEGITVKKISPSILMIVNLISPDKRYDDLFLSNYATIYVRDELGRLPGVADVSYYGQRDYSLRAWLDPNKLASLNLTTQDVVTAISQQNLQVAAGQIGQEPVPKGQQFQLTINTLGRLVDPEQFADIIVKAGTNNAASQTIAAASSDGASQTAAQSDSSGNTTTPQPQSTGIVRLRDVARVVLGSQQYEQSCTLDGYPSVAMNIFQLPDFNALNTADAVYAKMKELKTRFPEGVDYKIVYDTTPFVRESIREVFRTLRDAVLLVSLVILAFLQNWRAAVIPLVAVPVAIIGTFAAMAAFGFSLNNLSLFGLVLAIGIVVDDAIVVVENIERWLDEGLAPRDAARKAMEEVTGPVIAVGLVLFAVFVPAAFLGGVSGQFFRQFAVTIAVSTLISAFNSLTLSPALAALLLRPRGSASDPLTRLLNLLLGWFFRIFQAAFHAGETLYVRIVGVLLRISLFVMLFYGGLLILTYWQWTATPTSFIPQQDKGYLLINVQLPDSASVARTQKAMAQIEAIARKTKGVRHAMSISGQSIILGVNAPNLGSLYVLLDDFASRKGDVRQTADAIADLICRRCRTGVPDAVVSAFGAPPLEGLGETGGFKIMIEDRGNLGLEELQRVSDRIVKAGDETPGLQGLFHSSRINAPWLFLDIDRTKCMALGVPVSDVFGALQIYFGSYYVNNFNEFGRTWQVNVQADQQFRKKISDLRQIQVRNNQGQMIRLGTLMNVRNTSGPSFLTRYNLYSATAIAGNVAPGYSEGEGIERMQRVVKSQLPRSMAYDWTGLTYMQLQAGNAAMDVFALGVVFVFLVLSAQYESWSLPLAVILVTPLCLLCSISGVLWSGNDVNIFTQIGFVVLVGLAGKNAILIVEFAKQRRERGVGRREAALEASRLRLRPILMTSLAFIFGVIPLATADGAGAEMRRALGIAVFSGMLGVTFFGIFLTPVFFDIVQRGNKPNKIHELPAFSPDSSSNRE